MKKCCKCKAAKPLDQFGKNKSAKDGLAFECKECVRAYQRKARAVRGDEIRAADNARFHTEKRQISVARYRSSDKGRAAMARAHENWRGNHPHKYKANSDLNNALQAGRIFKQPCFICGASKVEGHHPDYSRPLDVVWLCVAHHKETHIMAEAICA